MGFEPTTTSLATRYSTTELLPHTPTKSRYRADSTFQVELFTIRDFYQGRFRRKNVRGDWKELHFLKFRQIPRSEGVFDVSQAREGLEMIRDF